MDIGRSADGGSPVQRDRSVVVCLSLRGWRWRLALGLLACGFLLGAGASLRAARPSLSWRRAGAVLRITAEEGRGPLAGAVYDRTRWSSGAPVRLDPTRVVRVGRGAYARTVVLLGPDPVRESIRLRPAPPRIVARSLGRRALVLRLSTALLLLRGAPAGSWRPSEPAVVRLPRGVADGDYVLAVRARNGAAARLAARVPALREVPVVHFGPPSGGAVYLTIDDGWYPSTRLLALMRQDHVPVTAFLTARAAQAHAAYWREFAAAGGVIEDHTASHPDLTRLDLQDQEEQWAEPERDFPRWFAVPPPLLGRPPYGAVSPAVRASAWAAGLRELVLWDVVWTPGKGFATWNGGPITAGDIILLHFVPGLGDAVQGLLIQLAAAGLHPAALPMPAAK